MSASGIGSAVEKMSIDIDHHIVPVLAANPPQMFWRFGDGANDFANRSAPAQLIEPIGGTGIGGTLQDLSIHLFNNLPRICRAGLLSVLAAARNAARLRATLVTSGAITDARAGYAPFPETLPVFGRVDDLIDERRGTAHRDEYPGVLERFRIGSAVEKMSIDIDHHVVPVLAANPPQMFWRFGDGANDFANRSAPAQRSSQSEARGSAERSRTCRYTCSITCLASAVQGC